MGELSEKNYIKGEKPELNAVFDLITERMHQRVIFDKLQDILKNYTLNNFRKAEDIVQIITDLNNSVTSFDTNQMTDDLTRKE